jgi:hypothetical protein
MNRKERSRWSKTVLWLHKSFPARGRVSVRSVPLQKLCGYCRLSDDRFLIRIDAKAPYRVKLDTILHEWAHVITWFGSDTEEDHGGEWGLAYAKIYREFLIWDYGRKKKHAVH